MAHLTLQHWGKGFSHLGVPLGSKNDAETKSEKQTNKTPAQGEEGAEGPSLKPVPGCAKGLSLGLGGRAHGVSLRLFSLGAER